MKILFLNPAAGFGGAERCLLDLGASLLASLPTAQVRMIAGAEGPLCQEAERLGMSVVTLPLGERMAEVGDSALVSHGRRATAAVATRMLRAAFEGVAYRGRLAAAIRDFGPALIHSNGIKMHLLAATIPRSAPLVWHLHDFISERPVVSWAMRSCAWRVNAAISNSRAVAEDARSALPGLSTSVIYNAIDTSVFAPTGKRADLDADAGDHPAPRPTVRVGLVATYARWKGHEIFLRAVKLLSARAEGPPIRFYVVGGPIYKTATSQYSESELRTLAQQLGIADRVAFIPFQRDIDHVYRALDVVIHASTRREPFGRTIVEAMSTGKAVVVTRGGGAEELYAEGVDAVGVPPRSPQHLADAISSLASDELRRARLGAAARVTAVRRFSRERLAGEALRVYRDAGARMAEIEPRPRP